MLEELHSSRSPSGRHRWGVCPGSIQAEATYTEDTAGPAALDGTRSHSLLEKIVRWEFIDKEGIAGSLPYFGQTITDEYGTFTVDAGRASRIYVAVEYIRNFVDEYGGTVLAEERVFPDGLVGRADMHGTVDVQIANQLCYVVLDFKDGMNPVTAEGNPQLEQYALGVLAKLDPANYPDKFRLVIVQPKLSLKGMAPISTWDVTPAELLAMVPVFIAQAAATDDPNAPRIPGESQCKYCKAKGTCAAFANQAMAGIGAFFGPVGGAAPAPALPTFLSNPFGFTPLDGTTTPDTPLVGGFAAPTVTPEVIPAGTPDLSHMLAQRDPNKMSDAMLVQFMDAAPLVEQFIKGVEQEVARRLHSGLAVPGYKLVIGRGSRKWAQPEEETVKKLTGMGIPKALLYKAPELLTVAQVETIAWVKKKDGLEETHSLSPIQRKRMEAEYVTKVEGKPVVVPMSDSRPAIVPDASAAFGPVAGVTPAPLPAFLQAPPATPSLPSWMS